MTDRVTVNRDKTALLPDNSSQKGYRISRDEAVELGLLDTAAKPIQERRSDPSLLRTVEKVGPTAKPQKRRSAKRK